MYEEDVFYRHEKADQWVRSKMDTKLEIIVLEKERLDILSYSSHNQMSMILEG